MVCLIVTLWFLEIELVMEKKSKEKTTGMPFGVNLMRSQVLYRAAQELVMD